MTQRARPDSDITSGSWTSTPLYEKLDEITPDDTTTQISANVGIDATETFRVGLSNVVEPPTSGSHIVYIRTKVGPGPGSNTINWTLSLREGDLTTIATDSWSQSDDDTYASRTMSLTEAEADSITDYTDLSAEVSATGDTANAAAVDAYVTWIEFNIPSAMYVYDGTQWKLATSGYFYDGTQWVSFSDVYIRTGESWE